MPSGAELSSIFLICSSNSGVSSIFPDAIPALSLDAATPSSVLLFKSEIIESTAGLFFTLKVDIAPLSTSAISSGADCIPEASASSQNCSND